MENKAPTIDRQEQRETALERLRSSVPLLGIELLRNPELGREAIKRGWREGGLWKTTLLPPDNCA